MELAERVGPSYDYWLDAPFALALLVYRELQDRDHRQRWLARIDRIEAAELMAMAFHDPQRLQGARRDAIADAAGKPDGDEIARAREMIEQLERSGAMCDTPEERAAHRQRYGVVS